MDENNKQAEARRVLDSIRQKGTPGPEETTTPAKPAQWLAGEDAAQLQKLVNQSRRIKPEESKDENLPDPESIDPISTNQIKEMRKFAVTKKETHPPIAETVYGAIIRSFCEVIDFFKPSLKTKRCITEGNHRCLYCGEKFPAVKKPSTNEEDEEEQKQPGPKKRE